MRFGDLTSFYIAISFCQMMALLGRVDFDWPDSVKYLFSFFSAFSLNIQLISPECTFTELNYLMTFIAIESLPIAAIVVLFVFVLIMGVFWRCPPVWKGFTLCCECFGFNGARWRDAKATRVKAWQETRDGLFGTAVFLVDFLYLPIVTTTLSAFSCHAHRDPDGTSIGEFLDASPDMRCWEGDHMVMVYIAIGAIVLYVVGIPVIITASMWRNRKWIYRLKRGSRHKPDMARVNRRLGHIIHRYTKTSYLWQVRVSGEKEV
jgi:hypothetical protein